MTMTDSRTESPVRVEMALQCPLPCEPGRTAQIYAEATTDLRITEICMPPDSEAVYVIAGDKDVRPDDGESWESFLARSPVVVSKGQHVTVMGRNLVSPARRLPVVLKVEKIASRDSSPAAGRGRPAIAPPRSPKTVERLPSEPRVRLLIERGYVSYLVGFIGQDASIPRSIRGSVGWSFDSPHAVIAEGEPVPEGSAIAVEMPAAVRLAIGSALRTHIPLNIHPDDRDDALVALANPIPPSAVAAPRRGKASPTAKPSLVAKAAASVKEAQPQPTPRETEMAFMQNTILQLEKRVADLEAIVLHRSDDAPGEILRAEDTSALVQPVTENSPV